MNKHDLLYNTINNCFAIQMTNSFCIEAILESDLRETYRDLFNMFGKLIPVFDFDADHIDESCDNIKLLSTLNIKVLVETCREQLHEEFQEEFYKEACKCINKFCDKNGNFVFTIDPFYDIMDIYWTYERKSTSRRFDDDQK